MDWVSEICVEPFKTTIKQPRASLMAQMVKNPSAMWETLIWSLDREDALEKGMATHSSFLAWRIPWTEVTVRGVAKSWTKLSN